LKLSSDVYHNFYLELVTQFNSCMMHTFLMCCKISNWSMEIMSVSILRSWKDVPQIVGMMALKASLSAYCSSVQSPFGVSTYQTCSLLAKLILILSSVNHVYQTVSQLLSPVWNIWLKSLACILV
jgi:hypothetical protein